MNSGADAVSQWLKEEGILSPLGSVLLVRVSAAPRQLSALAENSCVPRSTMAAVSVQRQDNASKSADIACSGHKAPRSQSAGVYPQLCGPWHMSCVGPGRAESCKHKPEGQGHCSKLQFKSLRNVGCRRMCKHPHYATFTLESAKVSKFTQVSP